ncbi:MULTISPECIES: MOSC domain-containing protein [Pseudomonas]|uniref:MOSC domain-containing protein n=1 Tax=Pseudomonas eucalypticola TaxID=2599595 RepID=A0A7D5D5B7_9PSED|nr:MULTISPECIES: MOSC domain-containing protein [Pseudomonas]QKZ02775.1 MOSC domain-containing protein [Pseudomonas eucalypticola]
MRLGRLEALLIGKAVPFTRDGTHSAIAKQPAGATIAVSTLGLQGDEQGDRRIHGGIDKAVHQYPSEHYASWHSHVGAHPLLQAPGAFGENLHTSGMTEDTVCLGDVIGCGSAVLEVSQTRQPCWKLNDRFVVGDMALQMQRTGMTGWYYRVLEEGEMSVGDSFELLTRPYPEWTLRRIISLLYHRSMDRAELVALRMLPLVPSWQRLVDRRLREGQVEDWSGRLHGSTSSI